MRAVAKGSSATLGGIVGGLPCWVSQEHTQPCEVVSIQMLLLFPERCEVSSGGILVPGAVALLRLGGSTPVSVLVPPNGEPGLQELRATRSMAPTGLVSMAHEQGWEPSVWKDQGASL